MEAILQRYLKQHQANNAVWIRTLINTHQFNTMYYLTDDDFKKLGWTVE